MSAFPHTASCWSQVLGAILCLLAAAGCQRREQTGTDTAAAPEPLAALNGSTTAPPAVPAIDGPTTDVLRASVWQCADGQKLVMRKLLREKAVAIDFHDGTRRLDQTTAASGARYADAVIVFSMNGGAATLERQGLPAVQCEERRSE